MFTNTDFTGAQTSNKDISHEISGRNQGDLFAKWDDPDKVQTQRVKAI